MAETASNESGGLTGRLAAVATVALLALFTTCVMRDGAQETLDGRTDRVEARPDGRAAGPLASLPVPSPAPPSAAGDAPAPERQDEDEVEAEDEAVLEEAEDWNKTYPFEEAFGRKGPVTLTVTVVDAHDRPVPHAGVSFRPKARKGLSAIGGFWAGSADASGRFTFKFDTHWLGVVRANHPDYTGRGEITVDLEKATDGYRVRLPGGRAARVKLVDGAPKDGGARITHWVASPLDDGRRSRAGGIGRDGSSILRLEPGRWLIRAFAPRKAGGYAEQVVTAKPGETAEVALTLPKGRAVSGEVVNVAGAQLDGVLVRWRVAWARPSGAAPQLEADGKLAEWSSSGGDPKRKKGFAVRIGTRGCSGWIYTDAKGRFELRGMPPGEVWLSVSDEPHFAREQLASAHSDNRLVVGQGAPSLRLRWPDLPARVGRTVLATSGGTQVYEYCMANPSEWHTLGPGTWRLYSRGSAKMNLHRVTIGATGTTELEERGRPSGELHLKLKHPESGDAYRPANIAFAWDGAVFETPAHFNKETQTTEIELPAGWPIRVIVDSPGREPWIQSMTLPPGGVVDRGVVQLPLLREK